MNINILKKAIEFAKMNGKNLDIKCSYIYNFLEKMNETVLNYAINDNLFNIEFLLLTGEIITIQYNEKLEFVSILSTFVNNELIDELNNYISEQLEHFDINNLDFNQLGIVSAFENIKYFIQTLK